MNPSRALPLLLPALLAFTAWAPAAQPAAKKPLPPKADASPGQEAVTFLTYTNETIGYPAHWKTGPKAKDLLSAVFYYQWDKPGRTCKSDTWPWARVTIGTEVAPCWPPDREFYKAVKKQPIAGATGTLYRRAQPLPADVASPDNCPGQSSMLLAFTTAGRCYTMKFLTSEKWLKLLFPDYTLIMNNFQVDK